MHTTATAAMMVLEIDCRQDRLDLPARRVGTSKPCREAEYTPLWMAQGPDPASSSAFRTRSRRQLGGLRIGAVLAVALVAGVIAWIVVDRTSDDTTTPAPAPTAAAARPAPATPPTTSTPAVIQPRVVSLSQLAAVADAAHTPLYWAGPRAGTRYELTRTASGTLYLRYLPRGREPGDRRPALTIVTYRLPDAMHAVEVAAKAAGSTRLSLAGGGVAVVERARPTNVHLAYPGQDAQVEVYAPEPGLARRLVVSGAIRPVS